MTIPRNLSNLAPGVSTAGVVGFAYTTPPTNGYRRNKVINGSMQIDQRNNGASSTISGFGYTVDRWIVSPTGANVAAQRVAGSTGYQYALQVTGAAGVTGLNIQQRIESYNVADLVNQNVTLSFTMSNSLLTSVTWNVTYANSVDNFGSSTLIATGTVTVSSTPTQYTVTFNAGANTANGILIQFVVGAQTSGTWTVTGVQFEAGSVATPFERLPYSETLILCQRYYSIINNNLQSGAVGYALATAYFPVTMRTTPSLTTISSGVQVNATFGGAGSVTNNSLYFQIITSSAGGYIVSFSIALSAEI